jgi:methylated-DNA-protein-cysteine methyltransferase related protein
MCAREKEGQLAEATFRGRVLALLARIPPGRVATYGQLARLAGRPRAARQVGVLLRGLSAGDAEALPWFRVINAQGGLSTYKVGAGELQRALLEAEGVPFDAAGRCELARYRFDFGSSGATLTDAAGGVVGS